MKAYEYELKDVLDPSLLASISPTPVLGIDIGSRNAKAVFIRDGTLVAVLVPTGISTKETAEELLDELRERSGLTVQDAAYVVCTGYGRNACVLPDVPSEVITEISCHAMGAHYLDAATRTIIDIGGQDAKGIQVDPKTGKVVRFRMNDKCAAGTGRFLERIARMLGYTPQEIGPAALSSTHEIEISSQCVVFAESEVVSLRARGERPEDIAAAVHRASARRVIRLLNQIPLQDDIVFSGGVSNNVGMRRALERLAGRPIAVPKLDTVYAGALGAAILAQQLTDSGQTFAAAFSAGPHSSVLAGLTRKLDDARLSFSERTGVRKIGYVCTYTPVELFDAAGAISIRLEKKGTPDVVERGEMLTKSVFCDVTKSLLGYFSAEDSVYQSLDRVVAFYTCDCMRAATDAVAHYFKPVMGYVVPRGRDEENARQMFREQILQLKKDLEDLTGRPITDDALRASMQVYKENRKLLRNISELRKRNRPPITGSDYLRLVRAYRTLDPRECRRILTRVYDELQKQPDDSCRRIRIMISGGMIADGDNTVMDLLEKDLGAEVVIEDHCTGVSPFLYEPKETGDPYTDLAAAYLDQAPCARQYPLQRRVDLSASLAQAYHVDGIVYSYIKFCPCYGMTKKVFMERYAAMGIPVLELDNDYATGDKGQIRTRLEAFVEVLREKIRV